MNWKQKALRPDQLRVLPKPEEKMLINERFVINDQGNVGSAVSYGAGVIKECLILNDIGQLKIGDLDPELINLAIGNKK